jgi:hypothetical protein
MPKQDDKPDPTKATLHQEPTPPINPEVTLRDRGDEAMAKAQETVKALSPDPNRPAPPEVSISAGQNSKDTLVGSVKFADASLAQACRGATLFLVRGRPNSQAAFPEGTCDFDDDGKAKVPRPLLHRFGDSKRFDLGPEVKK